MDSRKQQLRRNFLKRSLEDGKTGRVSKLARLSREVRQAEGDIDAMRDFQRAHGSKAQAIRALILREQKDSDIDEPRNYFDSAAPKPPLRSV